ncbi:hypothetical protein B0H12DRAFT_1327176 [Mycena haematopus]|nr:hypothetical protein B0H12DRAFT_1327176 [Mycena haematopus]
MAESKPRLPPELERHIFELAANSHFKSISTLLLVAHRVKTWLEPMLYSVMVASGALPGYVCFDAAHLSSAVQSPAISQHVKNLLTTCYAVPLVHLERILSRCSAIQDLALIGGDPIILPFISARPLRLSICRRLFPSAGVDFTHPLFSRLTHLQFIDGLDTTQEWSGLATIPNLTHLAFLRAKSLSIFRTALNTCPRLQVLIYLYSVDNPGAGLESLAHDTRFVCFLNPPFYEDWQIGARGGDDFWVRTEKFIAQRNCGEIDGETYICVAEEMIWQI